MGRDRDTELTASSLSRRRLLHAAGVTGASSLAGCLGGDRCTVLYDRVDDVPENDARTELVPIESGDRLYIKTVTLRGANPTVTITAADETVLHTVGPDSYIETVYETAADGPLQIALTNADSIQNGVWQTTIVRYNGWCPEVY